MEKFLILKPLLDMLANGKFFITLFKWFLRLVAILITLGTLWASWKMWFNIPGSAPAKIFLGALALQIFLLTIAFVVINIVLIRSNDVAKLPIVKNYSLTPIVVVCIRIIGEIIASLYLLVGLAIGITTLIAGRDLLSQMPFPHLPGLATGGGGLFIMIWCTIFSFISLLLAYFIAELTGAVVDIARNTRKS